MGKDTEWKCYLSKCMQAMGLSDQGIRTAEPDIAWQYRVSLSNRLRTSMYIDQKT